VAAEQTLALVVGIETYSRRKGLDLDGPAADAIKMARWLRARGVAAANIKLLLSCRDAHVEDSELAGVEIFQGEVTLDVLAKTLAEFRHTNASVLFVFWTGHGIMTSDHIRRPLLANYSDADAHNLNVESLQEHLRSTTYAYPPQQLLLFDMCATLFDERLRRESLVDHRFQAGPARTDCRQFLLYAAADRQAAENLTAEKTGLYFRELMPVLEQEPSWPPAMENVVAQVEVRFAELRSKNLTLQEPIYQSWRSPSGKADIKYLGGEEKAAEQAKRWFAIAAGCVIPSLLLSEFGIALAPPWPNRWAVAIATLPIPLLVYLGLANWSTSQRPVQLQQVMRWSVAAFVASAIAYLLLFLQFAVPLPDHWHREIGGFTYTPKAQTYREQNPGISEKDLIQDSGNDVEKVYTRGSLTAARAALVGSWLAIFLFGSSLASMYLIMQSRQQNPADPLTSPD
jgi:hypothetical protein